jgi:hypothetical protein
MCGRKLVRNADHIERPHWADMIGLERKLAGGRRSGWFRFVDFVVVFAGNCFAKIGVQMPRAVRAQRNALVRLLILGVFRSAKIPRWLCSANSLPHPAANNASRRPIREA